MSRIICQIWLFISLACVSNGRIFRILPVTLVALALFPTNAAASDEASAIASVNNIRSSIIRLAEVNWRLSQAARPLCPSQSAGYGLRFDSLDAYPVANRELISSALGISQLPQVLAIAPSGPSAKSELRVGDVILEINGQPTASVLADVDGVSTAHRLEFFLSTLNLSQSLILTIQRTGIDVATVTLSPVPSCTYVAVVVPEKSRKAYSDRQGLAVTSGMMSEISIDDQLAWVVGHELAHILLTDYVELHRIRGKRKEDLADELGLRLAQCAGYDTSAAIEYLNDFRRSRPLSFLPTFSHRSPKRRYEALRKLPINFDCNALSANWYQLTSAQF